MASALNTAAKICDDVLKQSVGGAVVRESFTHVSSAKRQKWFETGLKNRQREGLRHFQCQKSVVLGGKKRFKANVNARKQLLKI